MEMFKNMNKRLKYGGLATAATAGFVAVIILLNILVSGIMQRFPLSIDMTTEKLFEITQDTKDYLSDLTKDVAVTVLMDEKEFESASSYLKQAYEVINMYGKLSNRININYVDIYKNPTFTSKYPSHELSSNNIIVESGTSVKVLTLSDLFNISQDNYGNSQVTSSKAEQVMTSAILSVTADRIVAVSFLGGHGESGYDAFKSMLESNNYVVSEQSIVTGELDTEPDYLVISSPLSDYTDDELRKLDSYLDNGARFGKNLIYVADGQQPKLPRLEAFLAEWGIEVLEGVVLESDYNNVFNLDPAFIKVGYSAESYAERFISQKRQPAVYAARGMRRSFETSGNRTSTELLSFKDTTFLAPPDYDPAKSAKEYEGGPFSAAIIGERVKYDQTTPLKSKVIAISSVTALDPALLQNTSVTNGEYFIGLLDKISERNVNIYIVPKSLSGVAMELTTGQANTLGIVFAIVIPVAVLVLGVVIWLRRRHL